MKDTLTHLVHRRSIDNASALNADILHAFLQSSDNPDVRRSHFLSGRYENIYLGKNLIPGMADLIVQLETYALSIITETERDQPIPKRLKSGFWFNAMQPGQLTQPHVHDDDDELLSAVYYIEVPDNSGDLLLMQNSQTLTIEPTAGECVFFPPNLLHQVSCNNSDDLRLSIGLNFGPVELE